jgi:hypothetical protein
MSESQPGTQYVDRQTLYDELWQVPGTQLARKYGVSDVALGKACRRHDIPRPPPGYWTMRKHGYDVERTPLPPAGDPELECVEFHPVPAPPGHASDATTTTAGRNPIRVLDDLSSPHPLVEATRKQLRSVKGDDNRIVHSPAESVLNVAVASASISRALRIMDALIGAWEEAGGWVKPGVKSFLGHHSTAFGIDKDEVLVSLKERTEPIPDWKPPKDAYWHRYPPRRPNGDLVFAIDNYLREGLRSTWADGKRQRLEDLLDRIFDGLTAQVEAEKRHRLDRECEARQKAAAEQRRAVKQRSDEDEKKRRESLAHHVSRWQQAEGIRAYLAAVRHAVDAGKARPNDEAGFSEWFEWATWYADHLDPMVRATARPKPMKSPINKPIGELDLTSRTRPALVALGVSDCDTLCKVTERQIGEIEKQHSSRIWNEVCRVLEGLGYDVSGRRYWL